MINSSNSVHIDGTAFKNIDLDAMLSSDRTDKFTLWIVRPLALLTAVAFGIAMFMASAFLAMLALAMLPLLAVCMWAMKTKVERAIAAAHADDDEQNQNPNPNPVEAI